MTNNTDGPRSNPAIKNKLFKLKEWLTVPEAARHLSIFFGEEVNEGDVLRLALDGHLKLSVNFPNHVYAKSGDIVSIEDATYSTLSVDFIKKVNPNLKDRQDVKPVKIMTSLILDNERLLNMSDSVTMLRGVYDLLMVGYEVQWVENTYHELTGNPIVFVGMESEFAINHLEGSFVQDENGQIYQIQVDFPGMDLDETNLATNLFHQKQSPDCIPGNFRNDSVLVVRTQALIDLQERLSQEESEKEKPLGPRAEKTYLNIIGAMLEVIKGSHGKVKINNETDQKDLLTQKYAGFSGISERTLSEKFSLAKKAISEELE